MKCKKCKKCFGEMRHGKAIQNTLTGTPDFPDGEVITMSFSGPGRLIDCLKCQDCGRSVSMPSEAKQSPPEPQSTD